MDKSCISSADDSTTTTASSTTTTTNSNDNRDQFLRNLNKSSYKISKPLRTPSFDYQPPPRPPSSQPQSLPPQHQPPVYNINKNDFRDVVQKLTGSPAHERFSNPPPIQPPKPPSSRLQRIRPPPLAQISYRPPPLLNNAVPPQQPPNVNPNNPSATGTVVNSGNFGRVQRPVGPLSPLPPFPAVHAAAESPISFYMRHLQTSSSSTVDSDPKRFSGLSPLAPLVSPKWNNHGQAPQPPQELLPLPPQQTLLPSPTSASMGLHPFPMPSSPLPFGCFPSPRSPYALLSPSLLFSPSTAGQFGFQQLPLSPTPPVPSPRWKDN